jgi:hypothetical protein
MYTRTEAEKIVEMVRLNLYNQDLFCGAQAIHSEMEKRGVKPSVAVYQNHQPDPEPE